MDDTSAATLLTMARLVEAKAVSASEALQAAYRLGVLDGELKMAAVETPAAFGRHRELKEK